MPFEYQQYQPAFTGSIGELMQAPARAKAASLRARGAATANTLGGIGQAVTGTIGSILQDRADAPKREMAQLALQNARTEQAMQQQAAEVGKAVRALFESNPNPTPEQILQVAGPDLGPRIIDSLAKLKPDVPPDYTLGDQRRSGTTHQVLATATPTPEKPKTYPVVIAGPDGRPITKLVTEEEMLKGVQAYREPSAPAAEKPKFWVMRNGSPIRVSEAEYQAGDTPASTREQGRPVTSGDAGRIADLDTSLDDLAVLRDTVLPVNTTTGKREGTGATGTVAKVGAMLPNWATELTGWGAGAKSRQAVIDRVKQVIGKALEEGVLRKEDELKYEKILPTLSDVDSVVETKLAGLERAITLRRERMIDALTDAGYDLSRFVARGTSPPPSKQGDTVDTKIGSVVTVRGQRVRITKVLADGRFEGVPAE